MEWCEPNNVDLDYLYVGFWPKQVKKLPKLPARVRCPKCKRRFKPFYRECDDEGCFHAYMPKHKVK